MTHTATVLTPDSDAWPKLAPRWATCADVHPSGDLTFCRAWTIPSTHRGTEPLIVVRIEQDWTRIGPVEYAVPEPPHVAAGPGVLWADWRAEDVARALREIADALDAPAVAAPEQEGEDG